MATCVVCTKSGCSKFTDCKQLNPNVYSSLYYILAYTAELMTILMLLLPNLSTVARYLKLQQNLKK